MTNKPGQKSQRMNKVRGNGFWDEHGQMTTVVCIIVRIEC